MINTRSRLVSVRFTDGPIAVGDSDDMGEVRRGLADESLVSVEFLPP
jgi:hypothetical protein